MRIVMMMTAIGLLAACSGASDKPTQRQQIGQVWKYQDGSTGKVAYIGSANSVATMTAPDTFSVILVQPMRNGEKNVTVKLVGAPFRCDLSDCAVSATTDDGRTHRWHGRMADTNDGIEIKPSEKAYETLRAAKTVKIALAAGAQEQDYPFEFNVAGLDLKS
ncbi:MAG: hypothetical protein AB7E60_04720 [Sphingobium sp.]